MYIGKQEKRDRLPPAYTSTEDLSSLPLSSEIPPPLPSKPTGLPSFPPAAVMHQAATSTSTTTSQTQLTSNPNSEPSFKLDSADTKLQPIFARGNIRHILKYIGFAFFLAASFSLAIFGLTVQSIEDESLQTYHAIACVISVIGTAFLLDFSEQIKLAFTSLRLAFSLLVWLGFMTGALATIQLDKIYWYEPSASFHTLPQVFVILQEIFYMWYCFVLVIGRRPFFKMNRQKVLLNKKKKNYDLEA